MITEKDSLLKIKLKEQEKLQLKQYYPERIIKNRYKQSFKNTPQRIKKCKRTRKKEDLTFYVNFYFKQPQSFLLTASDKHQT